MAYQPYNNGDSGLSIRTKILSMFQELYAWKDGTQATLSTSTLKQFSPVAGDSDTLVVTSNSAWSISSYPAWAVPSVVFGSGNASVTITAGVNMGGQRTENIVFAFGTSTLSVPVTQLVYVPSFTLSVPDTLNILAGTAGANDWVTVNSNTSWTVFSAPSWVTLDKQGYTGNSTLTVTVALNPNTTDRTGSIVLKATGVADVSISVTQLGKIANTLSAYMTGTIGAALWSTQTLIITSDTSWVIDTLTIPSWLNIPTLSGTGNATITCTTKEANTAAERQKTITVTGTNITVPATFIVTQLTGVIPYISVDNLNIAAASPNLSDFFYVTSNVSWNIISWPSWCANPIPSPQSGSSGVTKVYVVADPNTGTVDRTGYIVVESVDKTIKTTLTFVQPFAYVPPTFAFGNSLGSFTEAGSTQSLIIASNTTWRLYGYPSWISADLTTHSNGGSLPITALSNVGNATRTYTLVFTWGVSNTTTLSITQSGNTVTVLADYYVAVNGSDSNPGTIDLPFATWAKGWSMLTSIKPKLCIRGGTYNVTSGVSFNGKSGTSGTYLEVFGYPGERPILNKSNTAASDYGLFLATNYVKFSNFEISGFKQFGTNKLSPGIYTFPSSVGASIGSSYCWFDNISSHDNAMGAWMHGKGMRFNNCDFYNNADPTSGSPVGSSPYGNGDGIEIYSNDPVTDVNDTTIVTNCRAWNNSDDGFDRSDNNNHVAFINCWSIDNGKLSDGTFTSGDGNGFKLGWLNGNFPTTIKTTLINCIATGNKNHGYDTNFGVTTVSNGVNGGTGIVRTYNCLGYANGQSPTADSYRATFKYAYSNPAPPVNVIKNSLSLNEHYLAVDVPSNTVIANCNFNITNGAGTVSPTVGSFESVTSGQLKAARNPDGSLPPINFMKPIAGSNLFTAGVTETITVYDTPTNTNVLATVVCGPQVGHLY